MITATRVFICLTPWLLAPPPASDSFSESDFTASTPQTVPLLPVPCSDPNTLSDYFLLPQPLPRWSPLLTAILTVAMRSPPCPPGIRALNGHLEVIKCGSRCDLALKTHFSKSPGLETERMQSPWGRDWSWGSGEGVDLPTVEVW